MDNTQALQQVTLFIVAGNFRRVNLSEQVFIVAEARRTEIFLSNTMTVEEKTHADEDLKQQVNARLRQFAPTWGEIAFVDITF